VKSVNVSASSKYERPISSETVEALFQGVGFTREHLQYWTNLRYPGDNYIKRWVTAMLVNGTIGTHFDFVFRRDPTKGDNTGDEADSPNKLPMPKGPVQL